jgi:hypothetical protein
VTAPLVLTTAAELREIMAAAVSEGIERAAGHAAGPALLDRNGLAEAFKCSASLIDKLRLRGMPCVRLGDAPRFDYDDCVAWLKARKEGVDS